MRARLQSESGQAMLVSVLFLVAIIGAVALTVDIGAWYRQQRQAQAVADAAALAGAQALPTSTSQAITYAARYGAANGGGITAGGITFQSDYEQNDTIVVKVERTSPGFFAKLFSINSVTTHATASARAGVPEQVVGAAPIVVNKLHPLLSGPGCPCFNTETTLPLGKDGAPGAFGLVNLDPNANNGNPNLASWIQFGFSGRLKLGDYGSDPGASFNSSLLSQALTARLGTELLFPVYDTLTGGGQNAQYDVIGWVAFHLDSFGDGNGNANLLTGYFTRVIWDGIQSASNKHLPDFGVYSVSLVN